MRVSLIVAVAKNGVIGADGEIPWRLPEDQKFFRRTTMGHALVFGRKTFESIGKALPGRMNLVLTRSPHAAVDGVEFLSGLDAAVARAREAGHVECFIAGGEAIYHEGLGMADRVYRTLVEAAPAGDTRFPELEAHAWSCVTETPFPIDERHAHAFVIETWDRIR